LHCVTGGGGGTVEEIAAAAAAAREAEEARLREELAAGAGKGRLFTDTSEFVRNIQVCFGCDWGIRICCGR
jgi:hypothetical protein